MITFWTPLGKHLYDFPFYAKLLITEKQLQILGGIFKLN